MKYFCRGKFWDEFGAIDCDPGDIVLCVVGGYRRGLVGYQLMDYRELGHELAHIS